ncbi:MAG: c-type cytochrome [Bacteroidota bacterium]
MKKILFITLLLLQFSCKKEPEVVTDVLVEETPNITKELGKELFEGKGMCFTCHKEDTKIIGPSIKEIATIYTDKKASIAIFLQGETDPIVDPTQFEIMKANFAITKTMTDEELKALEEYMLSFK